MKQAKLAIAKWIGSALIVVAVIGIVAWRVLNHLEQTSAQVAAATGQPSPVSVQTVKRGLIDQTLGAQATAGASQLVPIRTSLATATVAEAYVKLGSVVKKGEMLYRLESTLQDVALKSAREQLAIERHNQIAAKKQLEAVESLRAGGLVSADEVRAANKDYSDISQRVYVAEVAEQTAIENKNATLVTAPVTGVVTDGELHAGMVVRAGSDLLTLSAIDPIFVTMKLPDDRIKFTNIGQVASVSFYAFPNQAYEGVVAQLNPTVDDKTGLASLVIRLDNPKLELMTGMNGVATIKAQREGLQIPAVALIASKEGSPYVFVVNSNNQVDMRRIITNGQAEGFVEVVSGLSEGERVVVVGQSALKDKQFVRMGTEYAARK